MPTHGDMSQAAAELFTKRISSAKVLKASRERQLPAAAADEFLGVAHDVGPHTAAVGEERAVSQRPRDVRLGDAQGLEHLANLLQRGSLVPEAAHRLEAHEVEEADRLNGVGTARRGDDHGKPSSQLRPGRPTAPSHDGGGLRERVNPVARPRGGIGGWHSGDGRGLPHGFHGSARPLGRRRVGAGAAPDAAFTRRAIGSTSQASAWPWGESGARV